MPYPNEHACRLNNPDKYDRFNRKNCDRKHEGKCIDVIYGIKSGKSEEQAYRYPKKVWDEADARAHCKDHGGRFAAATKEHIMTVLIRNKSTGNLEPQEMGSTEIEEWFRKNTDEQGNVVEEMIQFAEAEIKADKEGGFDWVMSDYTLDRDMERIDPTGWDLKNFKKNPVLLWAHNVYTPAIGRVKSPKVSDGKLVGKIVFDPPEVDQFAGMIAAKVERGTISAGSVGYRTTRMEFPEDDEEKSTRDKPRMISRKQELYEFSLCNVPSNPAALILRGDPEKIEKTLNQFRGLFAPIISGNSEIGITDGKDYGSDSDEDMSEESEEAKDVVGHDDENEEGSERRIPEIPITKFSGSPRNPYGAHCSFQFKGGMDGYKKAWRLHFSQINGGGTSGRASGPIRGTVRRIAMIAAGMKPPCQVVGSEGIGPRTGPKSPLPGSYPEKPSDYGLSKWKSPSDENVDREKALRFTCNDLNIIKRAATEEIKRRIKDREESQISDNELQKRYKEFVPDDIDIGDMMLDKIYEIFGKFDFLIKSLGRQQEPAKDDNYIQELFGKRLDDQETSDQGDAEDENTDRESNGPEAKSAPRTIASLFKADEKA